MYIVQQQQKQQIRHPVQWKEKLVNMKSQFQLTIQINVSAYRIVCSLKPFLFNM